MRPLALAFLALPTWAVLLVGCDGNRPLEPRPPTGGPLAARVSGPVLAAPSSYYARATSETQIGVYWRDNSVNETGFEVHRSTTGEGGTFTLRFTAAANATAYIDTGLEPGTQYCYRIRAIKASGGAASYSAFSNTACAVPPLAPASLLRAVSSPTQIDISWQDNTIHETGFEVHRSATGVDGAYTAVTTTAANVTAYSDQGLELNKSYCYRVRTVRVSGDNTAYSSFSNAACGVTAPAAASGTMAFPTGSNSVEVVWVDNSTTEDGFRIQRSTDGGATWALANGSTPWAYANAITWDADATAEQPACYRVIAFNAAGEAAPSNAACTTPPARPTNLAATRLDAETVRLTWSDNSGVEDSYQVWYVRGDYCCSLACDAFDPYAGEWMIAELPANSTTYTYGTTSSSYSCLKLWFYVIATKDGGSSHKSVYVDVP
jgi:Fibronectin type III domain